MRNLLAIATILLLAPTAVLAAEPWEVVKDSDGVKVWMQETGPRGLPVLRARTRINASVIDVLAVITDIGPSCEWAGRCVEERLIERPDMLHTRMYSRRKGPWPLDDRDFELETSGVISNGGARVLIRFHTAAKARTPLPSGTVRMPVMRGSYLLERAGQATDITFRVEGDPGGWIPKWAISWTAAAIPYESLRALRKRVPKMRGRYVDVVRAFEKLAAAAP